MKAEEYALGMIETRGLVSAVVACDAMLKTSAVSLLRQQITRPALVCILIEGETAAVRAALDAGARAAAKVGPVIAVHLIPRPDARLRPLLAKLALDAHSLELLDAGLESLPVARLRALARARSDFPLSGREISLAKRATLLKHLRELPASPGSSQPTES